MIKTLPTPVQGFVNAVNEADLDALLALMAKDGVYIDSGRTFADEEAIRRYSDRELIGAHGKLVPRVAEDADDTFTLYGDFRSDTFLGLVKLIFVLDGDTIRSVDMEPSTGPSIRVAALVT